MTGRALITTFKFLLLVWTITNVQARRNKREGKGKSVFEVRKSLDPMLPAFSAKPPWTPTESRSPTRTKTKTEEREKKRRRRGRGRKKLRREGRNSKKSSNDRTSIDIKQGLRDLREISKRLNDLGDNLPPLKEQRGRDELFQAKNHLNIATEILSYELEHRKKQKYWQRMRSDVRKKTDADIVANLKAFELRDPGYDMEKPNLELDDSQFTSMGKAYSPRFGGRMNRMGASKGRKKSGNWNNPSSGVMFHR